MPAAAGRAAFMACPRRPATTEHLLSGCGPLHGQAVAARPAGTYSPALTPAMPCSCKSRAGWRCFQAPRSRPLTPCSGLPSARAPSPPAHSTRSFIPHKPPRPCDQIHRPGPPVAQLPRAGLPGLLRVLGSAPGPVRGPGHGRCGYDYRAIPPSYDGNRAIPGDRPGGISLLP